MKSSVLAAGAVSSALLAAGVADASLVTFSNDTLVGGGGDDTIIGALGDDLLDGALGNDLLFGDPGRDTLIGGAGDDTMEGGEGNDEYHFSSAFSDLMVDTDLVIEAPGGGDADTIRFLDNTTLADLVFNQLGEDLSINWGPGIIIVVNFFREQDGTTVEQLAFADGSFAALDIAPIPLPGMGLAFGGAALAACWRGRKRSSESA